MPLQLSADGEVEVTVSMQNVLQRHNGPRDLNSLVGKYLYITALVQEDTGALLTLLYPSLNPRFKDRFYAHMISSLRWNNSRDGVGFCEVCQVPVPSESDIHATLHQTWTSLSHPGAFQLRKL